ncbi:filamentous hemagglutinin N-terminal domain-containing protein [Sulfitobacter sediminilitoris]|uniref:two-partner secretion domain-containing protein n=1 Tax=Sulfitobacter sediminilitoris TaxID=2698830 RepID=UPI003605C1BC
MTGFFAFDNANSDELGPLTLSAGIEVNSPLNMGETFYGRFSGAPSGDNENNLGSVFSSDPRVRTLSVGTVFPLGLDGLTLNLELTDSRTAPDTLIAPSTSRFKRGSARLFYPFVRSRNRNISGQLTLDKQTDEQFLVAPSGGRAPIYKDNATVIRAAVDGFWLTEGGSAFEAGAVLSRGIDALGARTATEVGAGTPLSRQGADAEFTKLIVSGRLRQKINENFNFSLSGRAQTSFGDPLLTGEQFGIAGGQELSAFDAGTIKGDSGFVARAEVSAPRQANFGKTPLLISPYIFAAYGDVSLEQPTAQETADLSATSYGIGVEFNTLSKSNFRSATVRIEYARGPVMTTSRTTTASAFQAHSVSDGKGHRRYSRLALALTTALTPVWPLADTLPTGGTVVHGSAQIGTPSANTMTITQGSDRAVVNWDGFAIGQGARVDIRQPNADATILNRVTGDTTSQIHGQLNANGRVFVVNPNGIFIGPTGNVNTGSFVASTLNMRTEDFVTGKTVFEGNGASATVENAGNVQVVTGGYAALIGGKVKNSGTIQAPLGFVGLGAGERVTLDLSGDGFLQVAVPSDTDDDGLEALIENSGTIQANGGTVQISAATARNAARHAINMSGVVEATTVSGRNGRITLGGGSGGKVTVSGRMRASTIPTIQVTESIRPALRPERGGEITITGRDITLAGATLDASGENGGGDIRVGGEFQGGAGLPTAETLNLDAATTINADGITAGDGGRIILWSDVETTFAGNISARGGASDGNGGFVEVSGKELLSYRGLTDLRAPNGAPGELLLDPSNVEIVGSDAGDNQILNTDLMAQLELGDVEVATDGTGDLPNSFIDSLGEGNITVNAPISWAGSSVLTLNTDGFLGNDIIVNEQITAPDGGLTINAGNDSISGEISTGPSGSIQVGTFHLERGNWSQDDLTLPSFPTFEARNFVLDSGTSYLRAFGGDGGPQGIPYIIRDIYGLQGLGTLDGGQYFQLGNHIDASGTADWVSLDSPVNETQDAGFVPLFFNGNLNGNRYTISELFIRRYTADSEPDPAGLFSTLGSSAFISQLNIADADVAGSTAGILAARNDGLVFGVSTSGSLTVHTQSGGGSYGGGIVAENFGTIEASFSDATVSDILDPSSSFPGPSEGQYIGGIVAVNAGNIGIVRSNGNVSYTQALSGSIGGIAGDNQDSITDSYFTGSVTANPTAGVDVRLGGIAGINSGEIARVIANGPVTLTGSYSSANGGAVVGVDNESDTSVISSFYSVSGTGQLLSGTLGEETGASPGLFTYFEGAFPDEGTIPGTFVSLTDSEAFISLASSGGSWDFMDFWSFPRTASTRHGSIRSIR